MTRSLPEWIGKNDDEPPPPRVKLRVLEKFNHQCAGCTRTIRTGDIWTCDHIKALINGGANRETNLQPLCEWCNPKKNAADVAEKSDVYKSKLAHFGLKESKFRALAGGKLDHMKKKMDGTVVDRRTGIPLRVGSRAMTRTGASLFSRRQ